MPSLKDSTLIDFKEDSTTMRKKSLHASEKISSLPKDIILDSEIVTIEAEIKTKSSEEKRSSLNNRTIKRSKETTNI